MLALASRFAKSEKEPEQRPVPQHLAGRAAVPRLVR